MAQVKPYVTAGLNLLFPPRCVGCAAEVSAPHSLCSQCFSQLHFITDPMCQRCGTAFPYEVEAGALCVGCMEDPPLYDSLRAVWEYTAQTRPLVTHFKYADQTHRLPGYARQLQKISPHLDECDAVIPVPMHPRRIRQRKFNQSSLLAHGMVSGTSAPVWDRSLLRTRNTPPQAGLDRKARLSNVEGAFEVNHAYAMRLRGATVMLVDDVVTTGATIEACCHVLLQAGVRAIHVVALAKTGQQ